MGDDGHYEELKEPIENLAREIARKYIRELSREATKRAIISEIKGLKKEEIVDLEKEFKERSDEENVAHFKEAADKIFVEITQGSIKGSKIIEQISTVLEDSSGIGDYNIYKDLKTPVEDLAREITQNYVKELSREATKRAIKSKLGSLNEKQILELENEIKNKSDEEKLSQFEEAAEKIFSGIHAGSIKGDKKIDQISKILEPSFDTGISVPAGEKHNRINIRHPIALFVTPVVILLLAVSILVAVSSLSISPGNLNFELDEDDSGSDDLHITNEGKGILVWWADSDQPWLSLSQNRGVNSGTFSVTVDTADLNPGEHTGRITVQSPMGKEQCLVEVTVGSAIPPVGRQISTDPLLYVSPALDSFNFSLTPDTSESRQLRISNGGEGTLEWEVSANEKWINLSPNSGSNSGTVNVTVNSEALEPGEYEGTITIKSNGGDEEGIIHLNVTPGEEPILTVYPRSLYFKLNEGESSSQKLRISNSGEGTLEWEVSSEESWIDLDPPNGINSEVVTVTVDGGDLDPGEYEGTITIGSNGGNEDLPVKLEVLKVSKPPLLVVTPDPPSFKINLSEGASTSREFQISNGGGGTLEWEVLSDQWWITINPGEGINSDNVTVTINGDLEPGEYSGIITVNSNGGNKEGEITLNVIQEDTTDPTELGEITELRPGLLEKLPVLSLSPDPLSLNFSLLGGLSYSEQFKILNTGGGTLEWELSSEDSWITVSPEKGTNNETVKVTVDTEDMALGTHRGTIKIASNGGNKTGEVNLFVYDLK
jgi:hypothetical protein